MTDARTPKDQLLDALCAHVREHGFAGASLRPLARSAGTSDRMLIYHFGSKDRLIEAVLVRLASELEEALTRSVPAEPGRSLDACVADIMLLLRSEPMRPYMRVWLEVVAAAGLGSESFRTIGERLLSAFLPWLEARLPADVSDRPGTAAALLALVEGSIVMDAVGMGTTADRAARAFGAPVRGA